MHENTLTTEPLPFKVVTPFFQQNIACFQHQVTTYTSLYLYYFCFLNDLCTFKNMHTYLFQVFTSQQHSNMKIFHHDVNTSPCIATILDFWVYHVVFYTH